jgi:hypothetical protein
VYHVELRQFPHNMCRFNLGERELVDTIVGAWAREQWIEFGERKWNPHQARLTVLEGPQLAVEELAMGRGWRNAQRHSEDVTERVLEQARQDAQAAATAATEAEAGAAGADERLQPLLGSDPVALLAAWRLSAERRPELAPSETLALAEATLKSLDASER